VSGGSRRSHALQHVHLIFKYYVFNLNVISGPFPHRFRLAFRLPARSSDYQPDLVTYPNDRMITCTGLWDVPSIHTRPDVHHSSSKPSLSSTVASFTHCSKMSLLFANNNTETTIYASSLMIAILTRLHCTPRQGRGRFALLTLSKITQHRTSSN